MSEVIVHIGVHKTGTSAIQAFLARNRQRLAERGIHYQPTPEGEWPNHHLVAASFKYNSPAGYGENLVGRLLAEANDNRIVVSSEMFCEADLDIPRFLSALRGHEIRVIAYLRHPCEILLSAFDELVRYYNSEGLWTRPINDEPFAYDPGQYDSLAGWLSQDGMKVSISPYDAEQWRCGSLLHDFLHQIGVSAEGFDFDVGLINQRLPFWATERLRVLNQSQPTADQHASLLEKLREEPYTEGEYPLTIATVAACFRRMQEVLPSYRPYLRRGFGEEYLFRLPLASKDDGKSLARGGEPASFAIDSKRS